MKFLGYLFAVGAALATVVLIVSIMAKNENVAAGTFAQMPPPTPAPTRTPGPPVYTTPEPIPTLAQPLTEEGALRKALEIDSRTAIWRDKPWSIDTPRLEPGRVTVKWKSNDDDAETGPVWIVTIKGEVRLRLYLGQGHDDRGIFDGVTYYIAQKTGVFLGVSTG